MKCGNGQKAYLSVILDLHDNTILSYVLGPTKKIKQPKPDGISSLGCLDCFYYFHCLLDRLLFSNLGFRFS